MRRRNARRREEGEEGEEAESEQTTADGTLGTIAEPTQDTASMNNDNIEVEDVAVAAEDSVQTLKDKAKEKEAKPSTSVATSVPPPPPPKRHFTLLIDKSGSMTTRDCPNGRSRWELAKDAAKAFAQVCLTFDADHKVDVFFFGSRGKDEHMVVRSGGDIEARFARGPTEGTYLAGCLEKAIALVPYDQLHTILVITDGEASDKGPLEKVLVSASHMISRDECLAISFIQVGQDRGARRFLKMLDDDLTGCKFDIVDTKSCDEVAQIGLIETLRQAITD